MSEIKDNLLYLRVNLGLSQKELADLIKCTASAISQYESGQRSPSLHIAIKIADAFNITIDCLVGRDTSKCLDLKSINAHEFLRQIKINRLKKELAELESGDNGRDVL